MATLNKGTQPGVWVTYYYDAALIVTAVYAEEIDALRAINGDGLNRAGFVPFGTEIAEALK